MCRKFILGRLRKGKKDEHPAARRGTSAAGDAGAPRARSSGVVATHKPLKPRASIKKVVDAGYGRFSAANKQAAADRRSRRYDERRGITADDGVSRSQRAGASATVSSASHAHAQPRARMRALLTAHAAETHCVESTHAGVGTDGCIGTDEHIAASERRRRWAEHAALTAARYLCCAGADGIDESPDCSHRFAAHIFALKSLLVVKAAAGCYGEPLSASSRCEGVAAGDGPVARHLICIILTVRRAWAWAWHGHGNGACACVWA